jgi:hypothetical protein
MSENVQRFEHQVERVTVGSESGRLSDMEKEGWELVTAVMDRDTRLMRLYFKRPYRPFPRGWRELKGKMEAVAKEGSNER